MLEGRTVNLGIAEKEDVSLLTQWFSACYEGRLT